MQQIRISIEAGDPATIVELDNELETLRGHEPAGAELIDDPAPHTRALDPLLTTVLIALVAGMGGAVGKEVSGAVIAWLVERIRALAGRRKSVLILSVGDVSLKIDEHTEPASAAAKLVTGLL